MNFHPLQDRVVIERIEAEAKTAGGITIPRTAKEKPQQGRVVEFLIMNESDIMGVATEAAAKKAAA